MPESPGMTRWILVSLGGFSYLPEDSEDIPFGISGLAPSFIYIPLISPSLIVWYGNCSTESQLDSLHARHTQDLFWRAGQQIADESEGPGTIDE